MRDVYVIGVGMTRFAKFLDRSVKDLTREATENVLADANISMEDPQAAWFSNSNWGNYSGQHSIRGQVALRPLGIMGLPITNVENALC
jgi:acetyl-CoA acetyltransferase